MELVTWAYQILAAPMLKVLEKKAYLDADVVDNN